MNPRPIVELKSPKTHSRGTYRHIGKGQCGTVWALEGTGTVLKSANKGKVGQLSNDARQHKRIEKAFQQATVEFGQSVYVPRFSHTLQADDQQYWISHSDLLPESFEPTFSLLSDRIFPVPLPFREAIFDNFAPETVKSDRATFFAAQENQDCLVRLYLGRRTRQPRGRGFSLRNFDMNVNEMEDLHLDTPMLAKTLAHALAVMHWKAGVDANGIEFVLGSSPEIASAVATTDELKAADVDEIHTTSQKIDVDGQALGVWLLDFDRCQAFNRDSAGLKQLEKAFHFNDPYYPRPGGNDPKDKSLWKTFKDAYLHASQDLHSGRMAADFIDAVEAKGQET